MTIDARRRGCLLVAGRTGDVLASFIASGICAGALLVGAPADAAGDVGAITFATAIVEVQAGAPMACVEVERMGGSSGNVMVSYSTSDSGATSAPYYTSTSGILSWSDGDASARTIAVPISSSGAGRSFSVDLLSASGANFGPVPDTSVYLSPNTQSITDTVQFAPSVYASPAGATTMTATITRVGSTSVPATVGFATADGTAKAGVDYNSSSGILTWAAGDTSSRNVEVGLSPGAAGGKTFYLSLTSATGANFGSPLTATIELGASSPGSATLHTDGSCAATSGGFGIKVSGNKFTDLSGNPVQLIGSNFSGLENGPNPSYWPAFANSTLDFYQSLKNYQGSGINVIRLQLNTAYWLGYACGFSTSDYQAAVQNVVAKATQAGLYTILVAHWDMPNINGVGVCPHGQSGMPSADHVPAFWKSVADVFRDNPAVMFELFNEPYGANTTTEWTMSGDDSILANGGTLSALVYQYNDGGNITMMTHNQPYQVAGEIGLLKTIRAEGATNVVLASAGYWDGAVQEWLNIYNSNGNPDPLKQFAATWHDYPGWTGGPSYALAILAAGYPLVLTETWGFDANMNAVGNYSTGGAALNASAGYAYARAHGIGYVCGWQVNDWDGEQTLSLTATPPWSGCAAQ